MIAISTFRPLGECTDIDLNQLRAKKSWDEVFDAVILFGRFDPRMAHRNTTFIPCEDFPKIALLSRTASMCPGWSCILNADIVVAPNLISVWDEAVRRGCRAFSSFRYEYDPMDKDLGNAAVKDMGFDFFASEPSIWGQVCQEVPDDMRMGHGLWDSWLLGFFNVNLETRFYDVTSRKCIFHPRHENRKRVYEVGRVTDRYCSFSGAPRTRL